jgi:hypothetical protein
MKFFSRLKSRRVSYSVAAMFVVIVNGNALAAPVSARIQYINSHRHSEAVQYGQWDIAKRDSPVRSIHAALLKTGKVLLVAGSGNDQKNFDSKSFRSVIWDPATGEFKDIPTPWDAFCAGHVFLPDGKLLIAGGTRTYEDLEKTPKQEFEGLPDSYIFDPDTERYEKIEDMDHSRWYPTLVSLPSGNVLASSGLNDKGQILDGQTEIFDPATKQWTEHHELNQYFPTYPALILAADGRLFFTGSTAGYGPAEQARTPALWDLQQNTMQKVFGLTDPELTETSASLLLPPAQNQKVMLAGGGGVGDSEAATARTAIVDLTQANPAYVTGPNIPYGAVRYPNTVILPDDTVLTSGGSAGYREKDVLGAAIYHPDTNTFTKAASPAVGRNYHSEALLLPDGRVATFGSNSIDNSFELRVEIYSPAYLFKGTRPKITKVVKEITRGTKVDFTTSDPANIKTAKLIRPSSVTHVTDVEQRSINLAFTRTATGITADIPENMNLLPAGWYMAFVTDKNDVPSEATWVHVN